MSRLSRSVSCTAEDNGKKCLECGESFGVFLRKHECRRCNLFYCDDCTPSRIDLSESHPAPKCSRLLRVCRKCYTTVCQEKYIPQIIREFMDKVAPKREMLSSPPIEAVGLKCINKHSIKIVCDLRGHPAVSIPSGYKTSITFTNSRLITTTEVAPFPTFDEPKRISNTGVDPAWVAYRTELMKRGRSVVIDSNSNVIQFNNCYIKGRIGVGIFDAKSVVFRGCVIKGECAIEVRNNATVRLENCVLLASSDYKRYQEDRYVTPWGVADNLEEMSELMSILRPQLGPCFHGGVCVMAMDSSSVQLIDCMLMGLTGVYATHNSTVTMKVRASRSVYDIWSEATVVTKNVSHIGVVRVNSELCKYLVEKSKAKTPPQSSNNTWINDHEALLCAGCNLQFSVTERKHHCRLCGLIFCDRCTRERVFLPNLGVLEYSRICSHCTAQVMVPATIPELNYGPTKEIAEEDERKAKRNSGKFSDHVDSAHKFKISIPPDAVLQRQDAKVVIWVVEEFGFNIGVGVEPSDPDKGLENMVNRLAKMRENKAFYSELTEINITCGNDNCVGFLSKENQLNMSTGESKTSTDPHQWQMYVVGNNRIYTVQFKIPFGRLEILKFGMETIVKSFKPIV